MKFNYVSDLHVDDWVLITNNQVKNEKNIRQLVQTYLNNTEELYDVLCINGDIANLNLFILIVLDELSKYFKQILIVLGNHEFYLDSKNQIRKYKTSLKRIEELEENLPHNVHLLKEFKPFDYEGTIFAGDTSWYPITKEDEDFFDNKSNDSQNIKGLFLKDQHEIVVQNFNKLEKADVILTHVPPILVEENSYHSNTSCYLSPLPLEKTSTWLFGHTHLKNFKKEVNGVTLLSHAIGYKELDIHFNPNEDDYKLFKQKRKKAMADLLSQLKFLSYEV